MAAVDYERVLVRLKGEIAKQPSHGSRQLLATIGKLESECEIKEGDQVEFPVELRRGVRPALSGEAVAAAADG